MRSTGGQGPESVGPRGSGAGYPGDPGAEELGGGRRLDLGLLRLPYPVDPVLCPAGSREELVERLQTYTRQVSVGGMSG